MHIQIQKPTDLDLHCLQRQSISGLSRTRVKGEVSREKNWFKPSSHAPTPSSFPTDRSMAVLLLQFSCVRAGGGSIFGVCFFSVFVPHLSFFWCLGKAVLRDCDISWESSLILLYKCLDK